MTEPIEEGYPVLCGVEDCGRLLWVPCGRMASIILSETRAEIWARINPPEDCQVAGCGQEFAKGSTNNPDVIQWLKASVPERIISDI